MRRSHAAIFAVLFCILACWSETAHAQCSDPTNMLTPDGYLDGAQLLSLSDQELGGYVVGFVNGVLVSVVAGAERDCVQAINTCVAGKSVPDLMLAVHRFLADRPNSKRERAALVTFNAIFGPCFVEFWTGPSGAP